MSAQFDIHRVDDNVATLQKIALVLHRIEFEISRASCSATTSRHDGAAGPNRVLLYRENPPAQTRLPASSFATLQNAHGSVVELPPLSPILLTKEAS